MMKLGTDKDGYKKVQLSYEGKKIYKRAHVLVAEAFIPNPDNLPIVNHKDGIRDNNTIDNLEWCDTLYNNRYSWENFDRKAPHSTDKKCSLYINDEKIKDFYSISEACRYAKENYNIPYFQLQKHYTCKNARIELIKSATTSL